MRHHYLFSRTILGIALFAIATGPVLAGGVAILTTSLTDNGDNDGFADTRETVTLYPTFKNTSGVALSNVTARLYGLRPEVACLSVPQIAIGSLAVDEVVTPAAGFVFTVSDIDRTTLGLGPFDDLSTTFHVIVEADGVPQRVDSFKLTLDLDLDVSGGSGTAQYKEDFEGSGGSMGTFEVQDLDVGLSSLAASDGYRCQYNDPDAPNTNESPNLDCYVGSNAAHNDLVFWGMSGPSFSPAGGRGFSGFNSLFFGVDFGPPDNWTTPVSVLEAVRMTDAVHIARDAAAPTLTFVHQVSFADDRDFNPPPDHAIDRGVVMIQVADAAGDPAGPWFKVDPYQNPYDKQNAFGFNNCSFDPIDDGNTEDDFYAPAHPARRFGPSSTCYPERVYSHVGETSNGFASGNVGSTDGPGLAGLWGIGTWIESRVDLSRFRGRSVRVRFLASAIELNPNFATNWVEYYNLFGSPLVGDDGWWIDDVEISELVATPATVVVDDKDNSGLPGVSITDTDLDGFPDTCDNCPSEANPDQGDFDLDTIGDSCDLCALTPMNFDPDLDGVCGTDDNCPFDPNPAQTDFDNDGYGEACECADLDSTINPDAEESNDGVDENCSGDVDEITGTIGFFDAGGDKTLLSWPGQESCTRYRIGLATDPEFNIGCSLLQSIDPSRPVTAVPIENEVLYIMVRAHVPNVGSWGMSSLDTVRSVSCD